MWLLGEVEVAQRRLGAEVVAVAVVERIQPG